MTNDCAASIADGEVDLINETVHWNSDPETLAQLETFRDRILYTSRIVCADLRFHRLEQTVWNQDRPMTMSVLVEANGEHHARLVVDSLTAFSPQSVFGFVPMRVFERSNQVFLLSDANPSLAPGPRVIYVNQAFERMTGFERQQIVGATPRMLQGERTDPERRQQIRQALTQWTPITTEMVNYRKDGTCFDVELDITPIADSLGWYAYWFAIQRDITEEKKRHQEIATMAKAAGLAEGASNALHNIGNVLNSLLLTTYQLNKRLNSSFITTLKKVDQLLNEQGHDFAEFVHRDPRGQKLPSVISTITRAAEKQVKDVQTALLEITGNADHIAAVISEQRDDFQSKTEMEPVSIEQVVDQSLAACKAHFDESKIQVTKDFPPRLPLIKTNRHKVIQILANLFKNACEAFPQEHETVPEITITATLERDSVSIRITDNGVGIGHSQIEYIFERGYTTKSSGWGFGLHSCSATAKELGGELNVHSEGVGKGSTFELKLPTLRKPVK